MHTIFLAVLVPQVIVIMVTDTDQYRQLFCDGQEDPILGVGDADGVTMLVSLAGDLFELEFWVLTVREEESDRIIYSRGREHSFFGDTLECT